MEPDHPRDLTDDELADLARLADGTLPTARRAEVDARVAASPALAAAFERQGVALGALRRTATTGAPARLRAHVERRRAPRRARPRRGLLGGVAAAAGAAALALALVLPGALSGGPSLAEAAALGLRPPTLPAPQAVAGTPQLLRAAVDGVPFPNYRAKFGWAPTGARRDEPSGRHATTVFYEKGGRKIAYTIVGGDALDRPGGLRAQTRGGVTYRTYRDHGRTVVTWQRNGHTCVLSARAARPAELLALADWRGKGAIPF